MLGVAAADDPHNAAPADDPTVLADGLHAATNLHEPILRNAFLAELASITKARGPLNR